MWAAQKLALKRNDSFYTSGGLAPMGMPYIRQLVSLLHRRLNKLSVSLVMAVFILHSNP